ncbi:MAG: TlpA family protein disulfide reductase [Thermoanaerobaculia bacterium]
MSAASRSPALLVTFALALGSAGAGWAVDVAGLTRLNGSEVAPGDLPEDAIVIFFATWSPRCRGIVARFKEIQERWGDSATVLLVDFQEDRSAVEKFLNGKVPGSKVFLDRRAVFSKSSGITSLPGLLAVKDGTPAFRGKLPADVDSVLRPIFE